MSPLHYFPPIYLNFLVVQRNKRHGQSQILALGLFVGTDKKDDNEVGNFGSTIHLKVKCLGLQVCNLSAVFGLTQVLHQAGTLYHLVQPVGALPKNRAMHP